MAAPTRPPAGGTTLKVKISSAWTIQVGVVSISGPDVQTGEVDTTELDPYSESSTTPALESYELFKTFVAGWNNAGELAVEANLINATFAALYALQCAGTSAPIAIHFRNGYAFYCASAFIKGLGTNAAMGDELVKMPFSIKLSGKPTMITRAAADAL